MRSPAALIFAAIGGILGMHVGVAPTAPITKRVVHRVGTPSRKGRILRLRVDGNKLAAQAAEHMLTKRGRR